MIERAAIGFIFVLTIFVGIPRVQAENTPPSIVEQRQAYRDALRALRNNQIWKYKLLRKSLDEYILLGQLDYAYYKNRISTTPVLTLQKYLLENHYSVSSEYLRQRWLHHLAKKGKWDLFLKEFGDFVKDKRLFCYRLNRLLRRPDQDQAALMAQVEELWMTGKRLPAACRPVFQIWRRAGHMTRDLIFARIKLVMQRRRLSFARELSYYLAAPDRKWVKRWIRMHRRPSQELAKINYPVDTPVARMIVKHGIVRMAHRDPIAAMESWQSIKKSHRFFGEDENYVLRNVGILAAKRHLPQAVDWLSAVSADEDDRDLYRWRIKAALRDGDWQTAKQFVAALKEEEQKKPQWRYWQARIAEESEPEAGARNLYTDLARERNYYGFMAADRVGVPYSMQHRSVEVNPEELSDMLDRPEIQVAHELFNIGQIVDARRQWYWIIRHMNKRELQIAAVVSHQWGWYDRALFTVSKSGHMDDLDLRFPVLYRDKVESNARRSGVDTGWIYGVMRQESAFVSDARSTAGALGLMQLLPRTGRATARRLKLNIRSRRAILNVDNNLRLGTHYLKTVLRRHGGNQVVATAAYNAGSHRVKRWLPENEPMPADIWVDTIPFNETRNYVKNVLGFTAIYEHRLELTPTPLQDRMKTVKPRK